jgi:hypothetical protein
MGNLQRVPIAFSVGKGVHVPVNTGAANSIAVRPPAIPGAIEWQTLGVSSDNVMLAVPAIAAGATADVPFSFVPASLPIKFQLAPNASGVILAQLALPTLPVSLCIGCISQSLTFGLGAPVEAGSTSWTLQPRQAYQSATIGGSVRFFAPVKADAQSVTLVAWTVILCRPPTVT